MNSVLNIPNPHQTSSTTSKSYIKMKKTLHLLLVVLLLTSCDNSKNTIQTKNAVQEIDTTKAFNVENNWVLPNSTFEIHSINKSSNDTLSVVTCEDFVYSPFGLIIKKEDISTSKLNNFKVSDRKTKVDIGEVEFQVASFKSSKLILFLEDDPEASTHSYIFKGEINDKEVNFDNEIRIGMSKKEFITIFFEDFPEKLNDKYNNFILESCVLDIKHFYFFKGDKLESVKFKTDGYWALEY